MAVATGQCEVAVAWRARKRAAKTSRPWAQVADRLAGHQQWSRPFGLLRPVDEIAILTRRAMHEYGYTRDHLANVALAFRKHASRNPNATMGHKPLTREQYMDARWISEPLCLFDNCLETDGALAIVITCGRAGPRPAAAAGVRALVRAEHPAAAPGDDQLLQRRPAARPRVGVRAAAVGAARTSSPPTSPSRSSTTRSARSSRSRSRATASAPGARAATSPTTARSSGRTAGCPTNTAGGGMSEAYVHGFNLVLEGVRQIRGTSTSRSRTPSRRLVTSGEGVPTSAVLFRR